MINQITKTFIILTTNINSNIEIQKKKYSILQPSYKQPTNYSLNKEDIRNPLDVYKL